ncbi:hypothetical protein GCM10009691_07200 [Brevibacterium picturae]|uniref:Uncharacterized protein n=1 Tax=Brevibacterium picturae TaxID=260553 RepID=A0ABP4M124_9MICO
MCVQSRRVVPIVVALGRLRGSINSSLEYVVAGDDVFGLRDGSSGNGSVRIVQQLSINASRFVDVLVHETQLRKADRYFTQGSSPVSDTIGLPWSRFHDPMPPETL